MSLFNRFPKISQITPVYAIIVLIIYSWTILWFFWKLPSWLNFLSLGEIFLILVYSFTTNFLESLVVIFVLVLLAFLLPQKWFRDSFVARGTAFVIPLLAYAMFFTLQLQYIDGYPKELLLWSIPVVVMIVLLAYFIGEIQIIREGLESLSDRAIVLLYLSIPVSLISLIIAIIRNIPAVNKL